MLLRKIDITKLTEINFRARMTKIQLDALGVRLNRSAIIKQLIELRYFNDFHKSQACNLLEVRKLLRNGWNTEYLLVSTADNYDNELLQNSLHWAFPQTYYAVYCISSAFLRVAGYQDSSHAMVMKRMGILMSQKKYPYALSFLCNGADCKEFINIAKTELPSTIYFTPKPEIVDSQVCQFLSATRKIDLRERKYKTIIKTKNNTTKKNYNSEDWSRVSNNLGYTNILSLLYRKRIKANYHDIDTLLSPSLNAKVAYNNLIHIVEMMNIVHEAFLIKGIGEKNFYKFIDGLNQDVKERLERRFLMIRDKVFNKK